MSPQFRELLFMNQVFRFFSFAVLAFLWCPGQIRAQEQLPFDLFDSPIDNSRIYRHFEKTATRMMKEQADDEVERFQERLKQAEPACDIDVDQLDSFRPEGRRQTYEHLVKSTIYVGELYNCGRCDKTHAGFAGGVMISEDGLALTNYHVLEARNTGKTEGLYAMTWDGRCWAIDEILFAVEKDDLALVRLKADGYKFHAAPVASDSPRPMDPVRIVSHPYGEFYVMTHGEVSRYAAMRRVRGASNGGVWMEVTAPFGSGSSGCGVFNESGEVVGVVSSIRPLFREGNDGKKSPDERRSGSRRSYVELLLRKCVPLSAIRRGFESGK